MQNLNKLARMAKQITGFAFSGMTCMMLGAGKMVTATESLAPRNFSRSDRPMFSSAQDTTKNITFSSVNLKTKDGKKVFAFVQQPPSFPGGNQALRDYLTTNIPYLKAAQQNKKDEVIILNLIINEKGETEDIQVIKPQGVAMGQEVTAVLEKMPLWIPGKQNGKPLPVSYTFPIRF